MAFSARWRARHRGSRSERGAAAVEFAIVLTVLLLILLGIIDFGRLLFVQQAVKSASREGARVAAVRAYWDSNAADLTAPWVYPTTTNAASAAVSLAGGGPATVTAAQGTGASTSRADDFQLCTAAGPSISVTVTVNFKWLTPVGALPGLSAPGLTGTKPVSATTTMRCE